MQVCSHHIQHLSYITITMILNIQQIMKQSYHIHHHIATMHARVHASTTHAMCIQCKCASLLFTMHNTVPPNVCQQVKCSHAVPTSKMNEIEKLQRTNIQCHVSQQGCPAFAAVRHARSSSRLWCAYRLHH